MSSTFSKNTLLIVTLLFLNAPALAGEPPTPTADEQLAALEARCSASAEARATRHAETPLFERLGGASKIHELTQEVMRLHTENASIAHYVEGLELEEVARRVAQFMISGTGGPSVYEGPSLTESHAHLKLTNAHFLAAGGDIMRAMANLGHEQQEIDEVLCILLSLRHAVVIPEDAELDASR